jgi:hypothetical protein
MNEKIDKLVAEGGKLWQANGRTRIYFDINVDADIYYDASLDRFIIQQKNGVKSLGADESRVCDYLDKLSEIIQMY